MDIIVHAELCYSYLPWGKVWVGPVTVDPTDLAAFKEMAAIPRCMDQISVNERIVEQISSINQDWSTAIDPAVPTEGHYESIMSERIEYYDVHTWEEAAQRLFLLKSWSI